MMITMMRSVRKIEKCLERFSNLHPFISYAFFLIGLPIFLLGAVSMGTILITLPMALLFGWL